VDRDGVYGAPRLHMAAKSVGIQPHVGAEISVEGFGNLARPPSWMPNSFPARPVRLPLLVKSRTGYQNLCRLMTRYKLREKEKGTGTANLDEVAEHAEGLVCLRAFGIIANSKLRVGCSNEATSAIFVRQKRWCSYFRICRKRFRTRANSPQDSSTPWLISVTNFPAIPFPREKQWIRFFASA